MHFLLTLYIFKTAPILRHIYYCCCAAVYLRYNERFKFLDAFKIQFGCLCYSRIRWIFIGCSLVAVYFAKLKILFIENIFFRKIFVIYFFGRENFYNKFSPCSMFLMHKMINFSSFFFFLGKKNGRKNKIYDEDVDGDKLERKVWCVCVNEIADVHFCDIDVLL